MKTEPDYSESLLVHFRRVESLKKEAISFPSISLTTRQLCDLELLLNRAFYPLIGFLCKNDYENVIDNMRLADGTLWPIPTCLDIDEKTAKTLEPGASVALRDEEGFILAILNIKEVWKPDKRREAEAVFGTSDAQKHAGVQNLYDNTLDWYAGGSLEGLHLPVHYDAKELRLTPAETHCRFSQNGWRQVIGVQTEKYLHCAHREMTLRAAQESGASILLHPAIGFNSASDRDHYTLIRCYQEIVKKYPRNMITLALLPLAIRKAGPREALWHAIIRKNFGCSHFMVSDDHGDPMACQSDAERFYPLHAAQKMVQEHEQETGIKMVPLRKMVYVEEKAQYVIEDELEPTMRVKRISSAEFKRRLENGLEIPEWFSYPEIVAQLRKAYPPKAKQGFTIFLTGLSGAGKSTLAKVLMVKFMELLDRPVTLLDGDVVRQNLSSELTFSKEHRNLNVKRIGFVASEITKNGGVAICAPIAPFEESRRHNRELISKYGGYIEIYMATPLDVCEQRDRKGLYAKSRAGKVKGVTGIDDPYDIPKNPELTIDTSEMTPDEAAQQVMLYLNEQGYIG